MHAMTNPDSKPRGIVTACVLIIGNEILSGRTQDTNLNHLARVLGGWGIQIREARVIPDIDTTCPVVSTSIVKTRSYERPS